MSWYRTAWRKLFASGTREGIIKGWMPRSLFARALTIVVAPMVLLQAIISYMYLDRNAETVTVRMTRGVAGDIALMVALYERTRAFLPPEEIAEAASGRLGFSVGWIAGGELPAAESDQDSFLARALARELPNRIRKPVWFDAARLEDFADIRVAVEGGIFRIVVDEKRLTVTNSHIFLVWMMAFSLIIVGVAALFLRNQIKPIQRLALAADAFGHGRDVPDFKPSGATEVRAAAQSFIEMRERIVRQMQQRTEMLAGVSHDLKTPLTRMKLALAMMGDGADVEALRADVREMEHMVAEYLDFARGGAGEAPAPHQVQEILNDVAETARRSAEGKPARDVTLNASGNLAANVRRNALRRCIQNLVDNALKHGTRAVITASRKGAMIEIAVDDDGPGIPPARREEAFMPFHRLDEGRNLQMGGVGLGLAIARDIARAHGGDVTLGASPLGGLRAEIRIRADG